MRKQLIQDYADDGRLIEAGWQAIRRLALADDMSAERINECRLLFFLGAQHLLYHVYFEQWAS